VRRCFACRVVQFPEITFESTTRTRFDATDDHEARQGVTTSTSTGMTIGGEPGSAISNRLGDSSASGVSSNQFETKGRGGGITVANRESKGEPVNMTVQKARALASVRRYLSRAAVAPGNHRQSLE
jgi:hypothetical protein